MPIFYLSLDQKFLIDFYINNYNENLRQIDLLYLNNESIVQQINEISGIGNYQYSNSSVDNRFTHNMPNAHNIPNAHSMPNMDNRNIVVSNENNSITRNSQIYLQQQQRQHEYQRQQRERNQQRQRIERRQQRQQRQRREQREQRQRENSNLSRWNLFIPQNPQSTSNTPIANIQIDENTRNTNSSSIRLQPTRILQRGTNYEPQSTTNEVTTRSYEVSFPLSLPLFFDTSSNNSNNENTNRQPDILNNIMQEFYSSIVVRPSQTQINRATRLLRFSEIDEPKNISCPISLESFEAETNVTQIINCEHLFIPHHIQRWFLSNTRCPLCRYDIRNHE
jgi:hypothetical protein